MDQWVPDEYAHAYAECVWRVKTQLTGVPFGGFGANSRGFGGQDKLMIRFFPFQAFMIS